jgi:ligand-binding sensor protein
MQTSAEVIEELKKLLGIDVDFVAMTKIWDTVINIHGSHISGYKNGMIYISALNSMTKSEITKDRDRIINLLNQYLGNDKIRKIKVMVE